MWEVWDFVVKHAPAMWYITGSACFIVGTIIGIIRS